MEALGFLQDVADALEEGQQFASLDEGIALIDGKDDGTVPRAWRVGRPDRAVLAPAGAPPAFARAGFAGAPNACGSIQDALMPKAKVMALPRS